MNLDEIRSERKKWFEWKKYQTYDGSLREYKINRN